MKINHPALWLEEFPWINSQDHKYDRGYNVVNGGELGFLGATKLAAISSLRIGAGLVTILASKQTLSIYSTILTSVMVKPSANLVSFKEIISDKRVNSVLIGPGNGVTDATKQKVLAALKLAKNCILDADALTVFKDNPEELFTNVRDNAIITPHQGEFERLFTFNKSDPVTSCLDAAKRSGAVVVLKGPETIIANKQGEVIINNDTTPFLATAGSGDVLAGIIAGLVAQKVKLFYAAAIGVWIHSQAGKKFGAGLVSEDLPNLIPLVLKDIYKEKN